MTAAPPASVRAPDPAQVRGPAHGHAYAALLRAVNVGGSGALPMAELAAICRQAGLDAVRTYIASGNVVFRSAQPRAAIRAALEGRLAERMGAPMPVMLRDAAEMRRIVARNPFAGRPGNRVGVHFLDRPVTEAMLAECPGKAGDEEISPGECEFYVHYGHGMGRTKLRFPAAGACTVRNMNTVETLADMLES